MPLSDHAVRQIAAEVADRRIGRREWTVRFWVVVLTIAVLLLCIFAASLPHDACTAAPFDRSLRGKVYVCPPALPNDAPGL